MLGFYSASRTALAAIRLSLQQSAFRPPGPAASTAARSFSSTSRRNEAPHPDLLKAEEVTPDLLPHARRFAQLFAYSDIPKDALEITFARSSGPGGQHVNKTESKAMIRCDIENGVGKWLPPYLYNKLRGSEYFVRGPPEALLVTGQTSRKRTMNVNRAMLILHETIRNHALRSYVNQPSEQQAAHVQNLVSIARRARRNEKQRQSSKKSARRGDWD